MNLEITTIKQIIQFTLIFSIFWSCNNPAENTEKITDDEIASQSNSEFNKYISTLDRIPLPLVHNTLGLFPDISKNFDKKGFGKYKHSWATYPLGIYYNDGKTIGIIDCSIGDLGLVPFLTIFDLNGNKIDSTNFYSKSGQDMLYYGIEYLTLKNNKTIMVLDTVKQWEPNQDQSDRIESSMSISTGKTEYSISDNGKIKRN